MKKNYSFLIMVLALCGIILSVVLDNPQVAESQSRTGAAMEATVVAQNQFTDAFAPLYWNPGQNGFMNISVGGSGWSATVTLQRRFGSSDSWKDVTSYTEPVERSIIDRERQVQYRLGVKTGDFTSGSIPVRVSN